MFDVEVQGLDALIGKFDRLTKQIEDAKAEMPQQLLQWQRDDMHRTYPNMQAGHGGDETVAATSIWPRSRFARQHRAGPKRAGPRAFRPVARVLHSARPILRRELYEKLVERMTALIEKAMKWP